MRGINRRQMLVSTGAAFTAAVFTPGRSVAAAPEANIIETKVISLKPEFYHGWPTIARRKNGQLLVV
ncbi:MAG: hypothetical protein JXM70_02650, partial [Pirellulales bacterium]|nr:hypothetical protein [Pirellulales bacterium]